MNRKILQPQPTELNPIVVENYPYGSYRTLMRYWVESVKNKGDAILSNGLKIDVKSTTYPDGRLLAVRWKQPKVDLFALMIGKCPDYTFKGFMLAEELIQEKRLKDLGHGQGYAAEQTELKELFDLIFDGSET